MNPKTVARIAALYDAHKGPVSEADARLWNETARVTDVIFFHLTVGHGVTFLPVSGQPYLSIEGLRQAIWERRVQISMDSLTHPVWSEAANWRFRCVHDVLGHSDGADFSLGGERRAARRQAGYYPEHLRPVIVTEVYAQAVAYYAHGGVYQEQKCFTLPADVIRAVLS